MSTNTNHEQTLTAIETLQELEQDFLDIISEIKSGDDDPDLKEDMMFACIALIKYDKFDGCKTPKDIYRVLTGKDIYDD